MKSIFFYCINKIFGYIFFWYFRLFLLSQLFRLYMRLILFVFLILPIFDDPNGSLCVISQKTDSKLLKMTEKSIRGWIRLGILGSEPYWYLPVQETWVQKVTGSSRDKTQLSRSFRKNGWPLINLSETFNEALGDFS